MATSAPAAWPESRIERALLWFYRIVVAVLGVSALVQGESRQATVLGAALAIHALIYLASPRFRALAWFPWALTLLDVALAGLVFYLTGDASGPAFIIGLVLAGVLAARLALWQALGANLLLVVTFSLPFFYGWLGLDEPFPFPVVGNLLVYLALTFAINYLAAMEARQLRVGRDPAQRVQQRAAVGDMDHELQMRVDEMAALQRITRELNATLAMEPILQVVLDTAVQTAGATHGNVLLRDVATGQFELGVALGYTEEEEALIRQRLIGPEGENQALQVFNEGQSVIVADAAADSALPCDKAGTRSALAVPVFYEGSVVGVINLRHMQPDAFDQRHAAFVQSLAEQAALAIGNALRFQEQLRLNKTLMARNEQMSSLLEVSRKLRTDVPLEDTLEEIAYAIQETIGFDVVLISICEGVPGMMRRVAAAGLPLDQLEEIKRIRQPAARFEALYREEYRIGSCYFFPFQSRAEWAAELHTVESRAEADSWREGEWNPRDMLLVPLHGAGGRLLGQISLDEPRDGQRPSRQTLNALAIFANQAAIAVENANLYDDVQRRADGLAQLNQMAQAVTSTLDLPTLLRTVYEQTGHLMDATNFSIALYDEEKDELTFPFVVDPQGRGDWAPCSSDEGLAGRIVRSGQPLLLPRGTAEAGNGCRSWLGVPMIAGDRVLGVIAVQSYARENVYDEEHLNYLLTVASQSAMAVRNAQLYQQIVSFSSELEGMVEARTRDLAKALDELTVERDRVETLYGITRELGATLELDRVLQRALQLFARALGLEHGTILLLDQETDQLRLRATLDRERRLPRVGKPTHWRRGEGLAGWVLEHREPVLISDVEADDRWVSVPGQELNVRSVVAAPLALGGGDVLGVLTLGHEKVGYFDSDHLQLVTAATSQIAIAVNNSDLYAFITDQAEQLGAALQAKQEEAAKNRAILESIADGVLVLDHNGRVLLVNPAAEELLGFAAIALEGEHLRHMLDLGETPDDRELADALYGELRVRLETEGATEVEQWDSIRLEAGKRVLAVNIAPLVLAIGGTRGLVAALRDVSRQAEVERLKNEFISSVSHELRTPMTSIKGYTDLLFLGMAGGLTDAQRSFLQIIKSNADRLTALVNDILDISRIETGRLRLTIEPLNLLQLIDQVIVSFREQYREKGLDLQWSPPAMLDPVRGDAARVTQILSNLVANAWHYTPAGGCVNITAEEQGDFVHVHVQDTGIGIAPDNLGRIFDRFYRVDDPVVQEAGGTGLGLSIVKMFVEMLGGDIWVKSELGEGSTFSFSLPLARNGPPEPVLDLLVAAPVAARAHRPKILVVEDDRDLALLLRRELELDGYQVVVTGSGEDALWLAREEQPQLIALDIMLPDVDGFAVLERLKAHPVTQSIPVVITSVLAEPDKGYALGAVDYIVKPFSREQLVAAVSRALSSLPPIEPHRILVVDDDLDILTLMEEALRLHGYDVRTARDGREALERVTEYGPDLLLLDIKMPGVDGYEVIRRLKGVEATSGIPIVVITASPVDQERDKVRVLGMGADGYLAKPLSIENLIQEIKKAIAGKHEA
jgi:PAS domain S-box-containing protein